MKLQSIPMRTARTISQTIVRFYSVRDNVHVGRRVHIGVGSTLWAPDRLSIDDDVYIGKRCTIEVNGSVGRGTLIANDVGIVGRHDHDHRHVGSLMRHAPWIGDADTRSDLPEHSVTIGEDCWIGYGAIVLSGVSIGRGAVVSAGAVVAAAVPTYAVVAGCPARVVGTRFDAADIERHEQMLRAKPSGPSSAEF